MLDPEGPALLWRPTTLLQERGACQEVELLGVFPPPGCSLSGEKDRWMGSGKEKGGEEWPEQLLICKSQKSFLLVMPYNSGAFSQH